MMSPLIVNQMSSSNTTQKNNISPDCKRTLSKKEDNKDKSYMSVPQDVQDLYPDIICSNGIKLPSSTEEPLVSKIVRSTDCHQTAKSSSGTLANSLRNIKKQIRSKPFEPPEETVSTSLDKNSSSGVITNGFIEGKHDSNEDSVAVKPPPFHRPSLSAAMAASSLSGEDARLTRPIKQVKKPQSTTKIKAVIKNIKENTNKSKILMVFALCVLCLPGNIVTIWLKFQHYEEPSTR